MRLIALLPAFAFTLAPLAVEAQQRPSVARVAFLEGGNLESNLWQATRDGLRELGYVEGQNLSIEYRSAKQATSTIPIVMADRATPSVADSSRAWHGRAATSRVYRISPLR